MTRRLFVGLELPSSYQQSLAELDPHIRGLRWLPAEQLHLTMSFLGEVDSQHEATLREALAEVSVPEFFLPIQGAGAFGGSRPTVVWIGVGRGHPHLFALHHHIQDAVLHCGLEADLKPFHPHITVGRAKDVSRSALRPFLQDHAATEFGMWKVSAFTLFSSVLSSGGSTYHVEFRQPLSAAA
jgi:2'-5' RNA ligase